VESSSLLRFHGVAVSETPRADPGDVIWIGKRTSNFTVRGERYYLTQDSLFFREDPLRWEEFDWLSLSVLKN